MLPRVVASRVDEAAVGERHPAVTSAVIGPRTMEQHESQLPAPPQTLRDEILGCSPLPLHRLRA